MVKIKLNKINNNKINNKLFNIKEIKVKSKVLKNNFYILHVLRQHFYVYTNKIHNKVEYYKFNKNKIGFNKFINSILKYIRL
jgi:hypothetical protein